MYRCRNKHTIDYSTSTNSQKSKPTVKSLSATSQDKAAAKENPKKVAIATRSSTAPASSVKVPDKKGSVTVKDSVGRKTSKKKSVTKTDVMDVSPTAATDKPQSIKARPGKKSTGTAAFNQLCIII